MSVDTKADVSDEGTSVEEMATELGEAIVNTTEYQQFEEAKSAVEADEDAQEKIKKFERLRQEFMLARQTGEATQEDVTKVQEAQEDLHSLPVMAEYLDAQDKLSARLEDLNRAISDPLAVDFGQQAGGCCQDE
ncbi:YlbF family regulator [Haladaptatus caseinilyticus]|uniref:YlbF family regulator n=1 Tax=Haladaptatus caseinilyticus TaxID=2993314 RepID=UPI00224A5D49|nr:YlbF family regulator [Haladaptatus caseinilyticus]